MVKITSGNPVKLHFHTSVAAWGRFPKDLSEGNANFFILVYVICLWYFSFFCTPVTFIKAVDCGVELCGVFLFVFCQIHWDFWKYNLKKKKKVWFVSYFCFRWQKSQLSHKIPPFRLEVHFKTQQVFFSFLCSKQEPWDDLGMGSGKKNLKLY